VTWSVNSVLLISDDVSVALTVDETSSRTFNVFAAVEQMSWLGDGRSKLKKDK